MKFFLTVLFLFSLNYFSFSQENRGDIKFYIVENKNSISKDSLLAIGQININNDNYEIVQFTYIIDGFCINESGAAKYAVVNGYKFSNQMMEDLKQVSSSGRNDLLILDVFVKNKLIQSSPKIKIKGSFKIKIKN